MIFGLTWQHDRLIIEHSSIASCNGVCHLAGSYVGCGNINNEKILNKWTWKLNKKIYLMINNIAICWRWNNLSYANADPKGKDQTVEGLGSKSVWFVFL